VSILPAVLVIALVTAALRLLPVMLLGKGGKPLPPAAAFLSRAMPPAIIGLLVVYALRGTDLSAPPHGLPEAAGVCAAALLQYWKKNTLLSVFAATACYMALIRLL